MLGPLRAPLVAIYVVVIVVIVVYVVVAVVVVVVAIVAAAAVVVVFVVIIIVVIIVATNIHPISVSSEALFLTLALSTVLWAWHSCQNC